MKRIVKVFMFLALAGLSFKAMANEPSSLMVTKAEDQSLVFKLEAQPYESSLTLLDLEGNIIYYETVKEAVPFLKKLNLVSLEDGIYTLDVDLPMKRVVYTIEVADNNVAINDSVETMKPYFNRKGNLLLINFLNLDSTDVGVKVYSDGNQLLYTGKLDKEIVTGKALNFEEASKGSIYFVQVTIGDKTYVKEFRVS